MDLFYQRNIAKLRSLVDDCEAAATIPDRAELTSALTAVMYLADQRILFRPTEWMTLNEHVAQHRRCKESQGKAG